MKMFGGLKFWVCGFGELGKFGEVKREGVKSGYRTNGLITWAGLASFAEISAPELNATKINFAITWQTSQLGYLGSQYCDVGIPAGKFPSNHICRAARRMNHARNMHTASNLYIKMAAPGCLFSCNTRINVTWQKLASPARVFRPILRVVLSCSLHVKALEFAVFVVRVWEKSTWSN